MKQDIPEAYLNRGTVRSNTGDLPGGLADYDEALRLAPEGWRYRDQTVALRRPLLEKLGR